MDFYEYSIQDAQGNKISMEDYRGKVVLIVNTATECGFTPQYKDLEELYEEYHRHGLEIIDVPCNQFGGQSPLSNKEITEFCHLHYHTQFPQMKKANVNGKNALPLYNFLKKQKGFEGFGEGEKAQMMDEFIGKIDPDYKNNSDIKWNFTKFVVARMGMVVARFEPTAPMSDVRSCVLTCI